jgi:NAD(P)-dependent dehydrogenase (short-subunit alcohol dehydrogenase family)
MNISFSGRVVVVAGGTGGLGKAISLAFLEEDAKVIVTYRKEEAFRALKDAAGPKASSLEGSQVDVTDEAAVVPFINGVLTQFGALDALVNTVGGYVGGVKLWDMTARVFDQMLALNLRSGYVLAHAVMPAMLKAGHGSIVNVAAKVLWITGQAWRPTQRQRPPQSPSWIRLRRMPRARKCV